MTIKSLNGRFLSNFIFQASTSTKRTAMRKKAIWDNQHGGGRMNKCQRSHRRPRRRAARNETKLTVTFSIMVLLGVIGWLALRPQQPAASNHANNRNLIIKRDGSITIADRELGLQGDSAFKRIEYLHGIKCFLLERTDSSGDTQQKWVSADPLQGMIRLIYRTPEGKAYHGYDTVSPIEIDEAGQIEDVTLRLPTAQQ
jgi:hypothetical protein